MLSKSKSKGALSSKISFLISLSSSKRSLSILSIFLISFVVSFLSSSSKRSSSRVNISFSYVFVSFLSLSSSCISDVVLLDNPFISRGKASSSFSSNLSFFSATLRTSSSFSLFSSTKSSKTTVFLLSFSCCFFFSSFSLRRESLLFRKISETSDGKKGFRILCVKNDWVSSSP